MWWFMLIISALGRLKQNDLEFETSQNYIESSRPI
jgi:hypothetical protein